MFKIRRTIPINNKYYIKYRNGGWNKAPFGSPLQSRADVLANCVGYANGRFAEIQNLNYIKYQLISNAEDFIEEAKKYGLKISDKPYIGSIMVWQKGDRQNGRDGYGHVAIVERIINKDTILTSESSYRGKAFYNLIRRNKNGNWDMNDSYKFRGFILNKRF